MMTQFTWRQNHLSSLPAAGQNDIGITGIFLLLAKLWNGHLRILSFLAFARWSSLAGTIRERFCNTPAIQRHAYLLMFPRRRTKRFVQIASSYIRAIAFLCAPLTHRKPHRSIAFTGRNSRSHACWKRGLS